MTHDPKQPADDAGGRRIDTEVGRLARAGAMLHDGHDQAREMARDTGLRREIQALSQDNPEGSGPFRQHVGPDLLPAGKPSERAESALVATPGQPAPPHAMPASPDPGTTVVDGDKSALETDHATREVGAAWEIGVKSNTMLERNAHRLGIPQSALIQGRKGEKFLRDEAAAHEAAKKRRLFIIGGAVVAAFAAIGGIHFSGLLRDVEVTVKVLPSATAATPSSTSSPPVPTTAAPSAAALEAPVITPSAPAPAPAPPPEPAQSAGQPSASAPRASSVSPSAKKPPGNAAAGTPTKPPPETPGDKPLAGKPQF